MLFMENATDGDAAETLPGFATDARQVQTVSIIEQSSHPVNDLIDVSHLRTKSLSLTNHSRNAADSSAQDWTSAGHCFHQHASEGLRVAGQYESTGPPHEIS